MNDHILKPLRMRLARWFALRSVLTLVGVTGLLALGAVLSDAALDLPETARALAPWVLAFAVVIILALGLREWRRLSEVRLARRFELADLSLGDRLTNAVQLSARTGSSAVEECFRREAVELGRRSVAGLRSWPILRRRTYLAATMLAGVALAWMILAFAGRDLLRAVGPRFLDVRGDHPPYSRLKFEVAPGAAEVLYGGVVEVRAVVSGKPADKLWVVAKSGTNEVRAAMFLAPNRSFFQTLANLREATEYFVTDGTARSRRFPIRIRYTPQITLVEVTETFPEYTGKAARTAKWTDDTEALPEGTRISFRIASNRPLKAGALTLTPVLGGQPTQVELTPETQPSIVSGSFVLNEPTAFSLSVRDVDGFDSAEPRRGRFNILPDEKPRLFVLEPGRDAVATPGIRVPVRISASDDYGVSRVIWLRGHNRSIERPFNMKLSLHGTARSVESVGAFDLAQLGVRPGDSIEYYFEAADTWPKGPNVVLSRPFRLEIISKEQYEAILRQAAARKALFEPYFKLDAWLQRLAERSRNLQALADKSDPSVAAEAQRLANELEDYHNQLGKLLQTAVMFDLEQAFRTALVVQFTSVGEVKDKLKQALAPGPPSPGQLQEISKALGRIAETEREGVGGPAQEIASVISVLAKGDEFVKLARQQAVLAQMLRRFADRTNALSRLEQMEVQELAHQQRRVHEALRTWTTQLQELVARVPADAQYDPLRQDIEKFLKAVADAGIESDLSQAAIALGEPDTITGSVLAQRAADAMDKLIARCEAMPDTGRQCLAARFQPSLMKTGLADAVGQILAAMGAGSGYGDRDGYSLFNEDVALYGPNAELAGEQAGGRMDTAGGSGGTRTARLVAEPRDPGLHPPEVPGRVRPQTDAPFPLRYRDLVGEYFRTIAESAKEGEKQ